tara:strand:+ start:2692 stop:3021 length:330 start_codon:yes stop_codon:yes gene_type:complete
MRTKKLFSKVRRYLVLSKEFEQDADDLFEDRAVEASSTCITINNGTSFSVSGGSYDSSISLTSITTEAKTRAEVILDKALAESERSNRFDEYKSLQNTLSEYFQIIEKL